MLKLSKKLGRWAEIFEDGGNYLQKCTKEFINKKWNNFAGIFDDECPAEIHIPADSITNQYNIDLE